MGEALTIWGNSRLGAAENWGQFYQCVSATPSVELGTRVRIKVQLVKKEQACFSARGGVWCWWGRSEGCLLSPSLLLSG